MSADNGYILRKNSCGKFVVQHYMGETYPDVETAGLESDTLEDAVEYYNKLEANLDYPTEYGLTVSI